MKLVALLGVRVHYYDESLLLALITISAVLFDDWGWVRGTSAQILSCFVRTLAAVFHFNSQGVNLLADSPPKCVFFKTLRVCFSSALVDLVNAPSLGGYNDQQGSDEGFFEVRKAKTFSDFCDCCGELGWEIDGLILCEFRSAVLYQGMREERREDKSKRLTSNSHNIGLSRHLPAVRNGTCGRNDLDVLQCPDLIYRLLVQVLIEYSFGC